MPLTAVFKLRLTTCRKAIAAQLTIQFPGDRFLSCLFLNYLFPNYLLPKNLIPKNLFLNYQLSTTRYQLQLSTSH
ncbi:hypothetical protein [Teredinibacter turnerae]|uniref:hypothetical protein n=1 Tax=Teredinibacter turnerae TaxID=2426 RepID=UPI000362DB7B|nr:hypothetical protein [Teredinibacter turnerae]